MSGILGGLLFGADENAATPNQLACGKEMQLSHPVTSFFDLV